MSALTSAHGHEHYTTMLEAYRNENTTLQLGKDPPTAGSQAQPPTTTVAAKCTPSIGSFHTSELLWFGYQFGRDSASKMITFPLYSAPPDIAVGLRAVEIPNSGDARIAAYATDIQKGDFRIHLNNWYNRWSMYLCCTWLGTDLHDPDFQLGTSKIDTRPLSQHKMLNTYQVTFKRAYTSPPEVEVWIAAFHMSNKHNWRLKTYASDITTTGFKLHIDTWGDTVLHTATVSWAACTAKKPKVCIGNFRTPPESARSYGGRVAFRKDFKEPPQVFMAINSLDVDCSGAMKFSVTAPCLDPAGMRWNISSWADCTIYSAGVSFIALG